MTIRRLLLCWGTALAVASATAQDGLPGAPEDNGLQPVSPTVYINTSDLLNNARTESLGIAITSGGHVVLGWEDDSPTPAETPMDHLGATWTLINSLGEWVTPETEIVARHPDYAGATAYRRFLSFFRPDGSPTPGTGMWGPKIKANPFGDGFGMGVTGWAVADEIAELEAFDGGLRQDAPYVQLLNNAGEPLGVLTGVSAAYHQRDGGIRIGDWHYLANGNIVIAGESRQDADLETVFGGPAPNRHVILRVVSPTGEEVRAPQLASSDSSARGEMWHGVGVTRDGFAVRFSDNGAGVIRLFNNDGTPVGDNILLAELADQPIAGTGGRGDGVGFHGNGADAYAAVGTGLDEEGARRVWVTVINADGTLRWTRNVSDDLELGNVGRCDVGIDASGRVVVVYSGTLLSGDSPAVVFGRLFAADGAPLGGTFYVSELEMPDPVTLESRNPRVAFRNDTVAVTWESQNIEPGTRVVAARVLVVPVKPGSIESVGLTRIVPDTVVINQDLDALGNWEPYASVLGTSTFLIEGNAFAQDTSDQQRYVVALQPAAGGTMRTVEGFFADNGTAYAGPINASRQNGNPGRVAGDRRPGAVNYVVGGETSVHAFEPFQSGNRWDGGFDRGADGRFATLQAFRLDTATLAPTPLTLALDSANGRVTAGAAPGPEISRYGGDLAFLSDGNIVSVVDDRSGNLGDGATVVATVFTPEGVVVKESFAVAPGQIWANVAAFQGGFVVRAAGLLHFYDNAGNLQGDPVDQNTSGHSFDRGRGDGTRIAAHIHSPYVFLTGKVTDAPVVRVAAWDARDRSFVAAADVSEGGFRGDFDRAVVASDALNRLVVSWVARPEGYEQNQVAARVLSLDGTAKAFVPLTASFLPFINEGQGGQIRTIQMSVAMTTRQILVAAKGEINLQNQPAQGANSPREINFYTVISHPDPKDDPTPAVGSGGTAPRLMVTRTGGNVTVTSDPQPLPEGFVLELGPTVNGPWAPQAGVTTPVTVPIGNEPAVFLRARR